MSERRPYGDDPFLSDDPAAREREARRREREAKRLERQTREDEQRIRAEEREAEQQARDQQREAEQRARDQQRETERRAVAAERERERELELAQREQTRREYADSRYEQPVREEPPPGLFDEPAPELEPWVQRLPAATRGAYGSDGTGPRESRLRRRAPFLVVGLVILALVGWFLIALFQPFAGDPGAEKTVQIPQNSSLGTIAEILDEEGVISSATFFEIRATLAGRRSDFFAGTYTLNEGMSYSAAMDALTEPPPPARTKSVTIPEGLTRAQIADVVSETGIEGSYDKASQSSNVLDPTDYGADDPDNLEGFLFPDTYELRPKATAEDLVTAQLKRFEEQFTGVDMSYAESQGLTPYEVLIIASMVEEEAAVADDRPMVARVIYNRLADDGTLNIDATIRYAQGNYDEPLLESDLAADSPYNTYTRAGLPPTPIANPGIASIEAAANPPEGDWYFFVVKPGTCSELEFSVTAEEHDAAVEAYHAARDAAGGRSPVEC
jgi:UPF0755 protein